MSAQRIEPSTFPWLDPSRYSFSLGVEAGGATWAAGQTASTHDPESGRVVVTGDAATQAAVCWQKIGAVLEAAGRTQADCSEVVEYLTVEGLGDQEAIAALRPTERSASTIVVESLVRPTAHVEIEVVAGSSDGLVRLPQILPIDEDGQVVAPGDLVGQSNWTLEEAGRRLAEHGLGYADIVRTVQQTTPATRSQYRDTAEARRRLLGPEFPASTGILTSRLPHPEALVAIDVWASHHAKQVVQHEVEAYRPLTFAPAVVAGDLLFISGTTAWDPATGETVGDDIASQAAFIYDQIDRVCQSAGGSLADVVKTIEYITPAGLDRYREVGAVREQLLATPQPASTGVVIAGLLSRSWLIEVEAVAVLS